MKTTTGACWIWAMLGPTGCRDGDKLDTGEAPVDIAWGASFEAGEEGQLADLAWSRTRDRFLVSDPTAAGGYGAIYVLGDATTSLVRDPDQTWLGSNPTAALGKSVAAITVEGGEYVVAGESGIAGAGHWLSTPASDTSSTLAAGAILDIQGDVAGGSLGRAAAVLGDLVLVSQSEAADPVLVGPALMLAVGDGTVDLGSAGLLGDDATAGGLGSVAVAMASGEDGALLASAGGFAQHITPELRADWWVAYGGSATAGLGNPGDARTWASSVWVGRLRDVYVLGGLDEDGDAYARVLDPVTGEDLGGAPTGAFSAAEGLTLAGRRWTAWGLQGDRGGVRVERSDGSVDDFELPASAEGGCTPRLTSDGAAQLAFICQDGALGGRGEVR